MSAATPPWSTLKRVGLVPFENAFDAKLPAVMVFQRHDPRTDGAAASVSPAVVTGLLRDQLGYGGLVITTHSRWSRSARSATRSKGRRWRRSRPARTWSCSMLIQGLWPRSPTTPSQRWSPLFARASSGSHGLSAQSHTSWTQSTSVCVQRAERAFGPFTLRAPASEVS